MNPVFVNPLARNEPSIVACAQTLKQLIRQVLALEDDDVVSINELSCALPNCPPKETIILVMRQRKETLKVSIHKAMREVAIDDVAVAFRAVGLPVGDVPTTVPSEAGAAQTSGKPATPILFSRPC